MLAAQKLEALMVLSSCKRIREAFTVPAYITYLQKRFQWTPECTDMIDWLAYTQAIGRFKTRRIQITKLCNDLLPTAR